ncbi:MAG TPA: glycine betaine ABC transporter substrate-binding protein, partial [Acidimicrobiia bacterium]|nr:glycine betaine ABC transporter substrate-binding protein [Acidimicrobiia bacterium]
MRTRSRRTRLWVVLAVAASMLLAACGDDGTTATTASPGDGTTATTSAPADGDKPTINLAVNPWTASALNVEVAKLIIEENLGNPVEIVSIDENTMFTGMSDGTLDAALEIWPSGVTADEQAFFDDGTVANIGDLGTVGKIGWFTPSYVVEEYP